jgi:leucyl/phenylalanyl-tRNA--protein transferase
MKQVLSPELLLEAYSAGIFPMALDSRGHLGWFSPDPRALIPIDERFHVPHGLKRTLKKNHFQLTIDQDFCGVIEACATTHGRTWISPTLLRSYCNLHEAGFAHSIETRLEGRLVGGLYGVHIGGAFFGESMFHHETDASKVALCALVERLRRNQFLLLDTQWTTPHLTQFGAYEVPRDEYLALLTIALEKKCRFAVD